MSGETFSIGLLFQPGPPLLSSTCMRRKRENSIGWIIADGRHLPFKDGAFDITYSNSVIEHLGDFASQQALAREITRVGIRHFVQTPSKWFPVEPHLFTPFIHWLPRAVQERLLRNFTVWGLVTRPSRAECIRFLNEVRLLDYQQMKALFPQARILKERVLGITKSFIAVR